MRYADAFCTYTELANPHRYVYTGPCQVTKKPYTVTVLGEELYEYRKGTMAQVAFKTLSAEDREFLISGTSPAGWYFLFGQEEQKLIILQGPPGSGKSSYARKLACQLIDAVVISTDDRHFNDLGVYDFKPHRIGEFHQLTQQKALVLLSLGCTVIVDNTNILNLHIKPYVEMAVEKNIPVKFIRFEGKWPNSHGVPDDRVDKMREMMEELSVEAALAAEGPGGKKAP
jgi:shikimate kinase